MTLSDLRIRNAAPKDKAYKLTDGRGLYLLVQPNGSKLWRMKYSFMGREKSLAFGRYPEVGLAKWPDPSKCSEPFVRLGGLWGGVQAATASG